MGHPPRLRKATLVCLLFLFVVTESASKSGCTVGCRGMHPKKAYQEGHTYVYNLEGTSVTSVTGAQGDATLKLAATVELSVKPDCVHQLRLKNVQINGAPPSTPDVEQFPIQFNYHDGHIDTQLCTDSADSQASLNIKRAAVSMFQSAVMQDNGVTTRHETDVMGTCPTEFNFRKEGDSLIVNKNRNLAMCAFRENVDQALVSGSMDTAAGWKSSPVLGSQQSIEQRFKRGILTKAVSKEVYNLVPFSHGSAGAKTIVETTLTLKNEKSDNPTAEVSQPKSIIFEAPHPVLKSSPEAINNALKAAKTEVASRRTVRPEAAAKFADLVKVLRLSNKNDILSVYRKVRSDKNDQKLLLDALFQTGSGEAAEVGVELMKSKDLSTVQTLLFYASLTIIRHVHLPSVSAITTLLDQPNLPRLGYLGVGQVIGKYCQVHSCDNVPEVKQAVHKIREKVGNGKTKTREQENIVVSALKALGNTQFLDDATLQKLANIGADKNVRNRVRVAAIEALPTRCTMKWKNILFKVLADREEDSEIRIKSYLSMVACPCPHTASLLKEVLDKETVNQVGSFIQSHLRNLRASTDPSKLNAKNHLGLIKPRTKFPEDFRKFSFNNELSYKMDSLGIGSTLENNVIYSQNSFVPRSTNLNMTMELFGRNFNFLELNTRVENLDRVIEHYFGPKGKVWEVLDDLNTESTSTATSLGKYIKERYEKIRPKRDVKQAELDKFAKNVHLRNNEVDQELDVDLSAKLFGVELAHLSYQGDTHKLNPKAIIDKIFDSLEKGFGVVKDLDYDFENCLQFLDSDLVYPTGLGSALSLGLTGTSALRLKTGGKLDLKAILNDPKNAEFKLLTEASVSVNIVGNMLVKAPGAESGMKIVTTLHSATSNELIASVLDGHGIDIHYSIPEKTQEIINVESEVLLSSGAKGNEYVAPKFAKGKEHSGCFEQLASILGITICGKVSYPYQDLGTVIQKPLFPLSGPAKFAITLNNPQINKYHFKLDLNIKDEKKRSFELLLDNESSGSNKRLALILETGVEPNRYIKAALDTPIKKASVEAVLKNTPKERTVSVTILHDQVEYYGVIGVIASGSKYKPVLEYKVPEHVVKLAGPGKLTPYKYNLEGTIDVSDYEGGQKYVFEKVAFVIGGAKVIVVDGNLAWTPTSINVDTVISQESNRNIVFKLDGKKNNDDYKLSVSAIPNDPNSAFNLNWEFNREPNEMGQKLVFIYGPDPKSETNRLSLTQKVVYKLDPKDLLWSVYSELTYPVINLKLKYDGKLTRKSINTDIEVKYKLFKYGTELSAKRDTEKPGDYEVELEVEFMENSIEVKGKRIILDGHKSQFTNSLEMKPGGKYSADGMVIHDIGKNNVNLQLDGHLNLNGVKVKVDTGLEANPQLLNSVIEMKVDGATYINFQLKTKHSPNPSGTLSVNLKNYLTANGHYSYKGGQGDANLNVDIPKINRKIKATGTLTVSGSQHVGNLELLYDAEKDPSKRLKVSTVSDITKTSVDTKNVIEFLKYKLEANAKGQLQGTLQDGQLQLEADVTLPNGRHLVYKGKRNSAKKENKYDIRVSSELADYEQKGGPSRKFIYDTNIQDLDLVAITFKGNANLKYINKDGKDVRLTWSGKNVEQADKGKLRELSINLDGANIPKKLQVQLGCVHDANTGTYNVESSVGDDFSLASKVNLRHGNNVDKPYRADCDLEMKLPSEKLQNLKLELSSSMLDSDEADIMKATDNIKLTYNNDHKIELNSEIELKGLNKDMEGPSEGQGRLTLDIVNLPRIQLSSNYKYNPTPEKKTAMVNLDGQFGEKAISFRSDNEYLPTVAIVNIKAKANLLHEKLRNVDLQLAYKRLKEENKLTIDSKAVADGNKYTLNGEMQYLDTSSLFHVTSACPNGKTEIFSKFQKLNEKEYKGEWIVDTPKGFAKADAHVDLESIDNFVINANFDSDKIKHRKIHAEIANKPTPKNGKLITMAVTSDGKNIVTGSTNYKRRDEDGKIVVEGNGSMKVGDDTRSSSFKYTRQQLSQEKDGEVGVAIVLNVNFEPSAIVGELKLSNKELHVFNSYCEQNKDCAQFKLQSIMNVEQKKLLKHQVTVEVDLKKFNVPVEFGLKTRTELKNPIFDHKTNLYLHSSKDKTEYTYQLYIHPKEAASIVSLPSREVAAIFTYDLPKTKQTASYKVDASLYLDRKNKPSDKTSLSVNGDINIDKNSMSLNGETKFSYPTQSKDMVVKGNVHCNKEQQLLNANLDIDVFAKKSQKITIAVNVQNQELPEGKNLTSSVEVNSRGQQLKLDLKSHLTISTKQIGFGNFFTYNDVKQKPKTLGALFSADTSHVYLFVTLPDKELIKDDWKLDISKNKQKIYRELSLLGEAPRVMSYEANNLNPFKFEAYFKGNPKVKFSVNGQVVLGQLAEIHGNAIINGAKKELFHGLVHLDEKQFLKPDFGFNKENVAELVEINKNKILELVKKLKDVDDYALNQVKAEGTDFIEHLKKAQPNMKPLLDYYQTELNKIKDELNADESIKEIQATLNKYFGVLVTAITEMMKEIAKGLNKLQEQLTNITANLKEAIKSICPKLKQSYEKIFHQAMDILETLAKLANIYLNAVLDLINQHQKEINDTIGLVSGIVQDSAKVVLIALEQAKRSVEEFYTLLMNELKALPVYEVLKEKLEDLKNFEIPQTILVPIEELCRVTKSILPTAELQHLVDSICQYVFKHIKREKVDEANELKKIYSQLSSAIQSVLTLLQKQSSWGNLFSFVQVQPLDFTLLSRLPGISAIQSSVVNLLRNRELPTPLDLYRAYRPTAHLKDLIPPFSKSGVVTHGGHFFTFDGRHLSLPGTCTYVLAQDMQDGNFSVIANFNEGNLVSITVTELKESITLKSNGNILMNNKPAEFPTSTKNLHAYLFPPFSNIKSDYGVRVTCSNKSPMICVVHVSGFYLGKLRGILGDGNNEPYDDFTLPSGKITESGSEFGNAYKLKGECPEATAMDHKDHASICTDYFTSSNSPLKSCFNIVNPVLYREACDHATAVNTPNGACIIATAYHYACYEQGVMSTQLPASCVNCKVGANEIEVGDTFSVIVPKKEADIVFVVEQQTPNDKIYKEMIVPLMSEVREELKQQGITDVHIGLIGFSENMKWPQHYTLNGDTNIDGEVKNMKFHEKKPAVTWQEAKTGDTEKRLNYLRQKLDVELGTFKLTDAYETAIRYPFRPGAAKAVIAVIANPCEKSPFPISLQHLRLLLGHKIYRDLGLTYYHVSYPEELLVSGKPLKNIVGYDQDSVYTFADSKKKPLTGNTDMKSNLSPAINDVCADFAVSSGGAAFSSNNFLEAKPNQKKQFVQVAARRVVDGLINLELQKDCSCNYQYGMVGRPQCKIIGRKEVPRPAKGGAKAG
nr:apolipophorins [Bombus vancouverensis nearcticus]